MNTEQEPQAQAGEPDPLYEVDTYGRLQATKPHSVSPGDKFITLQSHREAMAFATNQAASAQYILDVALDAIAKKDAALDACVEALEASNDLIGSGLYKEAVPRAAAVMKSTAAITQAKEARK